jgi:hypothetical protein
MRPVNRFALQIVAAAAFVAASAVAAPAQFAPPVGPTAERNRAESERDLEERIAYQRLLAAWAANRRERKKADPKLAFEQLQIDFTRLQIVNKELVLTTAKTPDLDLKFVARSASEMNKRARRLLSNLALPEPPAAARPSPEPIPDAGGVKKSITALGWLVYRFAKNPLFQEAGVIDTQSAANASRELDGIIALSAELKRSSELLDKAARKSR